MKQFVYPAVFYKEEEECKVFFPDLNISTEGDTIEETYLLAKDYLRVYCTYGEKFDLEIPTPSKYEKVKDKFPSSVVMLLDAFVK